MSTGVQLTGEILPLATAVPTFPVFEDIRGKGGYYAAVLDIPARNAILSTFRKEGMLVYVKKTKCIYALQPDLTTWSIIANVNLGAQATWFIDPQNTTGTASDQNDGLTSGTALLTVAEFEARCFPNGQAIVATVTAITITILASSALTAPILYLNYLNGFFGAATVVDITVNCSFSSAAAITLATVTPINATTNTRGRLTTAAGAFVNKERIRVTSGAALGSMCYSMGLTSATDTFITCPGKDVLTAVSYPAPGDTVVVDTLLVTLGRAELHTGALCRIKVNDAKVTRALLFGPDLNSFAGAGGAITLQGCQASSAGGDWIAPFGAQFVNCRVPATGKTAFTGVNLLYVNCVVQGQMNLGNGSHYLAGLFIDGASLVCGQSDNFTHPGMTAQCKVYVTTNLNNVGSIEAENGPSVVNLPAILLCPGTIMQNDSFATEMWGVSGGYAVGFQCLPLSWFYFSNNPGGSTLLSALMKIASTVNIRAGGTSGVDFAYSNNPIVMKTLSCGVVVSPDIALTTENYVNLTAQTAAIGATNLLVANGARKGTYRVRGYISPTVVGTAGNLTLNAIYTDESGATITKAVCSIDNTVLSGVGGSVEVECNGTTNIQYSLTGFTAGLTYNVRIGIEYDSNGP